MVSQIKKGNIFFKLLLLGYRKIMGQAQAEEEVDRIMKMVDKNNSGAIDYTGNNFIYLKKINTKNFLFLRI